ncbi:hypothetical protein [Ruegeria sp. HKCCE3926]|uniref:hypothetical protein n=1 Tax=Ruegeria sp. HKCCE3926 TaxID=2794831 RepID=UPI001AE81991|nr:hypothetical protein [Ruegeria sp. HKCCE3926]
MTDRTDIDFFADAEEYWEAENWGLEYWTDHPTFLAADVALLKELSPTALKAVAIGLAATANEEMISEFKEQTNQKRNESRRSNPNNVVAERVAQIAWAEAHRINAGYSKPMTISRASTKVLEHVNEKLNKNRDPSLPEVSLKANTIYAYMKRYKP